MNSRFLREKILTRDWSLKLSRWKAGEERLCLQGKPTFLVHDFTATSIVRNRKCYNVYSARGVRDTRIWTTLMQLENNYQLYNATLTTASLSWYGNGEMLIIGHQAYIPCLSRRPISRRPKWDGDFSRARHQLPMSILFATAVGPQNGSSYLHAWVTVTVFLGFQCGCDYGVRAHAHVPFKVYGLFSNYVAFLY